MTALVRGTLRGAIAGGALFGAVQAGSLVWAALAGAGDPTTARASEAAAGALGQGRIAFGLGLVAAVAAAGVMVGAAQGFLRAWASPPAEGRSLPGVSADLAWSFVLLALWVLGRLCAFPALLTTALPRSRFLDAVAFHGAPWMANAIVGGLAAAATGAGAARRWGPLRAWWRRVPRAAVYAALAGTMTGELAFRSAEHGSNPRGDRTNVLILAADSVRPDHMSALGYSRATTPILDSLAAEGALLDRAMSPLAGTTPSWISILTGRYPHVHGVRHMFPDRRLRVGSLATLPRLAASQGYRTAVIADYAGDFFGTFDLGFERRILPPPLDIRTVFETHLLSRSPLALAFLAPLPESLRPRGFRYLMSGADPQRIASEVIGELGGDRPFFTVAFFSTTHVPFASPFPHHRSFVAPDYRGEHRFAYDVAGLDGIRRAQAALPPADARHVIGLYDGALRSVDAAVGRILAEVGRRGLDRSTLVVFLSDHGENLFEPGQTTLHGKWFRGGDEANRVPLIFRGAGVRAGLRFSQTVSLVDVAPTVVDLLGWPRLPADGRSLAPALRGAPLGAAPVFAETGLWLDGGVDPDGPSYPGLLELLEVDARDGGQIVLGVRFEDMVIAAKHRAVWSDPFKLVHEPTRSGAARVRLYDLSRDPQQTRDLRASEPAAGRLEMLLREWTARDPERELDGLGQLVRRGG